MLTQGPHRFSTLVSELVFTRLQTLLHNDQECYLFYMFVVRNMSFLSCKHLALNNDFHTPKQTYCFPKSNKCFLDALWFFKTKHFFDSIVISMDDTMTIPQRRIILHNKTSINAHSGDVK